MEHKDYDDPELEENEDDDPNMTMSLLSDEYLDEEEDKELNEFSTYLESLSDEDLLTQFNIWKAWLQETAKEIADAPSFLNLGALLQKFDEQALRVQLIQSIYYENYDEEIY